MSDLRIIVKATPKFFKKKLPVEAQMEFVCRQAYNAETVHIFLRENDDSDQPSRVRICLNKSQAALLRDQLAEILA